MLLCEKDQLSLLLLRISTAMTMTTHIKENSSLGLAYSSEAHGGSVAVSRQT